MVETYPFRLPLSLRSRVSLMRAGARLRLAVRRYAAIASVRQGEEPAARQQRIPEHLDDRSFSDFIGPLPDDVDSIFRATLNRSSGEPEELAAGYGIGYFHLVWNRSEGLSRNILGGSGRLIDALANGAGARIVLGAGGREGAPAAAALAGLDDAAVHERFLADLYALYPQAHGIVQEVVVQRWERGLPYAAVGRARIQAPLTRSLGRVHLAGDYLGTWYTETAIQT